MTAVASSSSPIFSTERPLHEPPPDLPPSPSASSCRLHFQSSRPLFLSAVTTTRRRCHCCSAPPIYPGSPPSRQPQRLAAAAASPITHQPAISLAPQHHNSLNSHLFIKTEELKRTQEALTRRCSGFNSVRDAKSLLCSHLEISSSLFKEFRICSSLKP